MLFVTLTAILESAFNAWLKLDKDAVTSLKALQGKVIGLEIRNPAMVLFFIPTDNSVQVMSEYDAEADVTMTGSALAFMRLSNAENSAQSLLNNGIEISGNMALAEQFSRIISEVEIDWEELLSTATGDIVAHQAGQFFQQSKGWLDDTAQAMRLNTSEYLQEESRVLPAEVEIQTYLDEVDVLRDDVERIEARLARLQSQLNTPPESR